MNPLDFQDNPADLYRMAKQKAQMQSFTKKQYFQQQQQK